MTKIKVNYEHTDTFGGESNYSWVNRGSFEFHPTATDRQIIICVKRELGLTGVPCTKMEYSGIIELRPKGICQVVFINTNVGVIHENI